MRRPVLAVVGCVLLLLVLSAGACLAQEQGEAAEGGVSPWHDGVHFLGLVGGGLAVLAFLGGLVVFLGFEARGRRWNDPVRHKLRMLHIVLGASGALLSLAHHVGRLVQDHELVFETRPPFLCGYGFAVLLVSGALRMWTPKAWRKAWRVFPWLHRIGFVVALIYLFRHARYQWLQFEGRPH